MSKKIWMAAMAAAMMALSAVAQNGVGDWRIHTAFVGTDVKTVVDTHQWVYYLTGNDLFRLDKGTQENEALNKVNDLSDMTISQIYYNSDKDYLVIVYSDANIDIICTDGSVVNMSEVKDAVMTSSKNINDVTFADGVIYLATDFGYVVIDDSKFVVKESHIYGTPLTSVAQVGSTLLLSTADEFYYGDAGEYHELLSSFSTAAAHHDCRMVPIDDKSFFCLTGWTFVMTVKDENDGTKSFGSYAIIENKTTVLQKTIDGFLLNIPNLGKWFKTDKEGYNPQATDSEGEIASCNPNCNGAVWAAGEKGLHKVGETSYYVPNTLSFSTPFWMAYNKATDKLYVSSPATNAFFPNTMPSYINTYDGMTWRNVTPENAPKNGTFWIDFMPDDPSTYFIGGWTNGLHKVTNDQIVLTYNADNSPMKKLQGAMHPITTVDRSGNVWVVQSFENEEHPVMVLPAVKAKQSQVSASDWLTPDISGLYTGHTKRASFISTKKGNYDIKLFTDGDFQMPLVMWYNNNGEISSNPAQKTFNRLTDQDGIPFTWTYIMCLTEDLNGEVWMGSTEGIVSFNPAAAFGTTPFTVNHIKVPRNDGTGMADYLMDGIQVNSIAVDGANRKWIGTQSSGLFLVSANGTEIIKKFNTGNSPLVSNTIYRVCCNPNSNSVYVTTPAGMYEYFSDSSPAEETYDNIYAYPNPVRPDFGGDVTITGMMDNSLVKIADAGGNVIRQLKSTGGMVTWDCCDEYGDAVPTGVYMVICSQANGSGNSAVTKIAVIR